jgi:hypothetical protein
MRIWGTKSSRNPCPTGSAGKASSCRDTSKRITMENETRERFARVANAIVGLGISFLLAFPIMLIVNYEFTPTVLSALFGVAQMTFWRAFWLSMLINILFRDTVTVND